MAGLPGHLVEDVVLENMEIIYAGGGDSTINYFPVAEAGQLTNAVADYPEFSMFGEVPAWGIYVRHTHNIRMKNIRLVQLKPDYRTGLLLLETNAVDAHKIHFTGPVTTPAVILMKTGQRNLRKIRLNIKKLKVS